MLVIIDQLDMERMFHRGNNLLSLRAIDAASLNIFKAEVGGKEMGAQIWGYNSISHPFIK